MGPLFSVGGEYLLECPISKLLRDNRQTGFSPVITSKRPFFAQKVCVNVYKFFELFLPDEHLVLKAFDQDSDNHSTPVQPS
jgi:hypothetical protein